MKIQNYIYFLIFALLTIQCAKQTAPTGGPKDEEPPVLVKATPPNQKVNFKEKEIELIFNEQIQLNNPREQLIITPTIGTFGKDYEIIARKNKVVLSFKSELKENTTYSINFRETIADLNEKNTVPLKFAISTGTFIDSLHIKGKVFDILTSQSVKNYTVAVAVKSDTFDIFKHTPLSFTYTDKESYYSIENLKEGEYILYAFEDKNKNLKVDSRSERYGFISQPIDLKKSIDTIDIGTYKLDAGHLKLISARPVGNIFNIKTNKSLVDYSIESTDPNQILFHIKDNDLSNIKVYNTLIEKDSLQARFVALDSAHNKVDTLIYVKFLKKESTKEKFQIYPDKFTYFTESKTLTGEIKFNKPVLGITNDSIYINVDSATTINFNKGDLILSESSNKIKLHKIIPELLPNQSTEKQKISRTPQKVTPTEKVYGKLILGKGAFVSAEIDTIPKTDVEIKTLKPEDVAIISYKVNSKENFVLQIINKNQVVIEESRNKPSGTFTNLQAGTYQLRLIIDSNSNGKWDPGDYKKGINPEKIIFYKNSKDELDINIKANWEVGPLLISNE
jgi:uncharacterized protein (DUF2141 family)